VTSTRCEARFNDGCVPLSGAKRCAPADHFRVWTHSYEAKHASIFDVYYSAWGAPEKREYAVGQVRLLAPVIAQREARAVSLVSVVSQQLLEVGLSEDPLHAVLMVGVGTSNGWVADVDARRTLFLALELLPDPPFDRVLVTHEAVHTVQAGVDWPATVAADLWREGSATAFSRHLCPDLGDSAYLWFDDEHADWVRSCEADTQIITTMARDNIVNADEAIVRGLFSLPDNSPIPHRAGYWLETSSSAT